MRLCPSCQTTYPDDAVTCRRDGSSLVVARRGPLGLVPGAPRSLEDAGDATSLEAIESLDVEPDPTSGSVVRLASFDLVAGGAAAPRASGPAPRASDPAPRASGPAPRASDPAPRASGPAPGDAAQAGRPRPRRSSPLKATRAEDLVGQVLGSYRLLEVIGRGGMGRVYRAEHLKLGRLVALKLLRPEYAVRREAVARFFQEAKAVNRIRHRNIVDVTDLVELDDGTTFIIMELLEGQSLGRRLRVAGSLEAGTTLGLLVQVCDALEAAHAVGIVHRDLKPDNIFLVPDPAAGELVKLLDFGVAKLVAASGGDDEDFQHKTAAGAVVGTPAYMSPEQASGMPVDPRSDIYSLGAIMYELFTGQSLFTGKSFGEFVQKHLGATPIRPRDTKGGAGLPPDLEAIILRCLEKDREARYPTVAQLKEDLLAQLAILDTEVPIPPRLSGSGWEARRTPASSDASFRSAPDLTPAVPSTPPPALGSARNPGATPDPAWGAVPVASRGTIAPPSAPSRPEPAPAWPPVIVSPDLQPGHPGDAGAPAGAGGGERMAAARRAAPAPSVTALVAPPGPGRAASLAGPTLTPAPTPARPTSAPGLTTAPGLAAPSYGYGRATPSHGHALPVPRRDARDDDAPLGDPSIDFDMPTDRPPRRASGTAGRLLGLVAIGGLIVGGVLVLRQLGTPAPPPEVTVRATSAVPAPPPPPPPYDGVITIKFRTEPDRAAVLAEGNRRVCTTPCDVTIDPHDGGATDLRTYVLRRAGYQDQEVVVPIPGDPVREARVELKRRR